MGKKDSYGNSGMGIYTLLNLKWITNKGLL